MWPTVWRSLVWSVVFNENWTCVLAREQVSWGLCLGFLNFFIGCQDDWFLQFNNYQKALQSLWKCLYNFWCIFIVDSLLYVIEATEPVVFWNKCQPVIVWHNYCTWYYSFTFGIHNVASILEISYCHVSW